jgi:PAS domain S-box-containing protein
LICLKALAANYSYSDAVAHFAPSNFLTGTTPLHQRTFMPGGDLAQIKSMSRIFFDGIGVGATLTDIHTTRILFANAAFARLVGYTVDELTAGMTFLDLTHPEDRKRNFEVHGTMMNGMVDHYRIDKRYVRKDGAIVWGHVTGTPIADESGELRWSTGIIEDITEQQLLRQRLALSEELSGLAAWRWDVKAGTVELSPAYNHVLGLSSSASSFSFDEFLDHVHPDDKASVSDFLNLKGNTYTSEYRIVRPDGRIRWLRGMASCVLDAAGEVTELVGATLDITEVKLRMQTATTDKKLLAMMQFIEENWDKKFKVEEIAARFGISSRKIFRLFASRGTTLMDFVKDIRLQKVRQRLAAPEPATTVTGVSLDCGFNNLGHFARDYRRKFGELPSETLRRHQQR